MSVVLGTVDFKIEIQFKQTTTLFSDKKNLEYFTVLKGNVDLILFHVYLQIKELDVCEAM